MTSLGAAEQWGRVQALLDPLDWHDLDRTRLLLECGCTPGQTSALTMAQADLLGAWLEADPSYLLGVSTQPVLHPRLYHNVPQQLWTALMGAAQTGYLANVILLKTRGVNLDRLRPSTDTEDPRSMLAVVLVLKRPLGSYQVRSWQLWQPEPWIYPKARAHVLSVLLLLRTLDRLGFGGCFPQGLEISPQEMQGLNEGQLHVAAVLGHHRWLPNWDVKQFLNPPGLNGARRRREIEECLLHYGDWRVLLRGLTKPAPTG